MDRYDTFEFSGDETMNGTIGASALSEQGVVGGGHAARITSNAHGLLASGKCPGIFIQDLGNSIYNGMRKILAVATNTFDIALQTKFAALTPAGTELWYVGVQYDVPWELLGWQLSMSATGGAAENMVAALVSNSHANFNHTINTTAMNAVQFERKTFDPPVEFGAKDILKFTYANTNDRTWAMRIFARRLTQ